jgi:hypothetical protein
LSKSLKDVQAWKRKAALVKRETISSKKQKFQNCMKNLGYRRQLKSSQIHLNLVNRHESTMTEVQS